MPTQHALCAQVFPSQLNHRHRSHRARFEAALESRRVVKASATCCAVTVSQADAVMAFRKIRVVSKTTTRQTSNLLFGEGECAIARLVGVAEGNGSFLRLLRRSAGPLSSRHRPCGPRCSACRLQRDKGSPRRWFELARSRRPLLAQDKKKRGHLFLRETSQVTSAVRPLLIEATIFPPGIVSTALFRTRDEFVTGSGLVV